MNKVLIIGRGGREHALAMKFSESPHVSTIFVAPGNVGMKDVATTIDIDENNFSELIKFAKKENIKLTFVGPEVPLVNGIVDKFKENNLNIFGPTKAASIIEGSKDFSKNLMKKYNIPTAEYETFTELRPAVEYLKKSKPPYVLKADGLAAGKGVVICNNINEAENTLKDMLSQNKFGDAGAKVVIEEFLVGEEFSFMAFVNNEKVYPLELSKDHKTVFENNQGPNTGGMGAYSPVPSITKEIIESSVKNILNPTAKAMVKEGRPFTGVLYAGLISTVDGVKVIEFNARFGDPETEVLLPRLQSDLFLILQDILNDKDINLKWSEEACIGVVLCSDGYPNKYKTEIPINGLKEVSKNINVLHSGTKEKNSEIVTSGGRVLVLTNIANNLKKARENIYNEIEKIKFDGMHFRKDIADV
ncbi:MAG: phosphoribosylamine--glycine ligase [Defluviitaleaceae bacterium]|nr:phosphoribosylamine--glycine ligase [Defluviitaleaceae bacterium]